MTEVVDFRDHDRPNSDFQKDGHPDYVYIGRENNYYGFEESIFHNPYREDEYGREKCIRLFGKYFHERLDEDSEFQEAVKELQGKTLGCWCKPKDCHGDVIRDYIYRNDNAEFLNGRGA